MKATGQAGAKPARMPRIGRAARAAFTATSNPTRGKGKGGGFNPGFNFQVGKNAKGRATAGGLTGGKGGGGGGIKVQGGNVNITIHQGGKPGDQPGNAHVAGGKLGKQPGAQPGNDHLPAQQQQMVDADRAANAKGQNPADVPPGAQEKGGWFTGAGHGMAEVKDGAGGAGKGAAAGAGGGAGGAGADAIPDDML